jgi:hypothetical protein
MADVYEFQHAFQGESGLPKDEMVNTFHFEKAVDATGVLGDIANAIKDFYWAVPTGAVVPMGTYLSHTINSFPATIKAYRLLDAKPRPEAYNGGYAVSGLVDPASTEVVPFEVACCVSYHATPIAGVLPGRLRGRIYVGPWNGAALGLDGRPLASLRTQMIAAAVQLHEAVISHGYYWGVFSPTRTLAGGGTPTIARITDISMDDAWDTQRRRGNAPTTRVHHGF